MVNVCPNFDVGIGYDDGFVIKTLIKKSINGESITILYGLYICSVQKSKIR